MTDTSQAERNFMAAPAATDAVDAAAMARLCGYLEKAKKAGPVSERDEMIARDAAMTFFRWGATWALRTSTSLATQLAQPALKDGVAALLSLLQRVDQRESNVEEARETLRLLRSEAAREDINSWRVMDLCEVALKQLEQGESAVALTESLRVI